MQIEKPLAAQSAKSKGRLDAHGATFEEAVRVAQTTSRDICRTLLGDLEKLVNALHSLIGPLQRADLNRDAPEARRLWDRAASLLQDLSRTVEGLKDCAAGVGPDGQPLLSEVEKARLKQLMDRARRAAEAGDLPIPDELYFKARQGDPDAIRRLEDFLKGAGGGIRRGAEITAELLLLLVGLMGSLGRKPAF